MPRSPGSSCAPTPAGMNGNCAPSYVAASACRVRPLHTSLVNGSGYRPGRMPWHGPEEPSASRTFTPRHSAWALWVLTRCARRLPASKDAQQSTDGPGRHDVSLPDRHWLRVPLALSRPRRAWCQYWPNRSSPSVPPRRKVKRSRSVRSRAGRRRGGRHRRAPRLRSASLFSPQDTRRGPNSRTVTSPPRRCVTPDEQVRSHLTNKTRRTTAAMITLRPPGCKLLACRSVTVIDAGRWPIAPGRDH